MNEGYGAMGARCWGTWAVLCRQTSKFPVWCLTRRLLLPCLGAFCSRFLPCFTTQHYRGHVIEIEMGASLCRVYLSRHAIDLTDFRCLRKWHAVCEVKGKRRGARRQGTGGKCTEAWTWFPRQENGLRINSYSQTWGVEVNDWDAN